MFIKCTEYKKSLLLLGQKIKNHFDQSFLETKPIDTELILVQSNQKKQKKKTKWR